MCEYEDLAGDGEGNEQQEQKWVCEHDGRELDGPDDTPGCENCDEDTGRCSCPISMAKDEKWPHSSSDESVSKSSSSSSRLSSSGATRSSGGAGGGRIYRHRDTSARGIDSSPYGPPGNGTRNPRKQTRQGFAGNSTESENPKDEKKFYGRPACVFRDPRFAKKKVSSDKASRESSNDGDEVIDLEENEIDDLEEGGSDEMCEEVEAVHRQRGPDGAEPSDFFGPPPPEDAIIEEPAIGRESGFGEVEIIRLDNDSIDRDVTDPAWEFQISNPYDPWQVPFGRFPYLGSLEQDPWCQDPDLL